MAMEQVCSKHPPRCLEISGEGSRLEELGACAKVLSLFFLNEPTSEPMSSAVSQLRDYFEAGGVWPFVEEPVSNDLFERLFREWNGEAELRADYHRLFIGPEALEAPPWGSVYTDRECVIFGESEHGLRRWMRSNGLVRKDCFRTPEDHIGTMCQMIAWLSENRRELLAPYLEEHFLTWSFHYFEKLDKAGRGGAYSVLAKISWNTFDGAKRTLGLHPKSARFYR